MEEDMYPGEETWKTESRREEKRLEILMLLLATTVILAILVIYGDVLGIYDKIAETYKDIWEIIFPR